MHGGRQQAEGSDIKLRETRLWVDDLGLLELPCFNTEP